MSGFIGQHKNTIYREAALVATILVCIILAVIVNFWLGDDRVYTHIFYIPIILAGLWHHKKAVFVALFLGILHISLDYMAFGVIIPNSILRAVVFIIVALFAGTLAKEKDWLNQKLKASNSELSSAIESYPDATLVIDRNGKVVFWNRAMEEMTGVNYADIVGKGDHEYSIPFYGERRKMLIDMLGLPIEEVRKDYPDITRRNGSLEARALKVRVRGADVYVYCTASRFYDKNGDVIGAIESIRDITEQMVMEEALMEAHYELEARVEVRTAELANARNMLQTILDTIPTGIIVAEAGTGRVTYMTKNAEDMMGIGPGANVLVPENNPYQLIRTDGTPFPIAERPLVRSLLYGDHITNLDMVIRRADGREISVLVSSVPVYDEEGGIVSAVGSIRDITERRRSLEALRESEEKFRRLVESINDWVWEIDENAAYRYSSPKIKDILGYEPQRAIGKNPLDFMPPDEAKRFSRTLDNIMTLKEPFALVEHAMIGKDGRPVTLESSGTPIFNAGGEFKGFRGISRDITARKKAEIALLKSEARNAALLNALPDMILRISKDGTILDIKAESRVEFNMPPEDFLGKNIYELWPVDLVRKFMASIDKAIKTGAVQVTEYPAMIKGNLHYEEARFIAASKDEAMMIVRDMTDERSRMEELRKARDDLDRRMKEASSGLDRAQATLEAVVSTTGADIIIVDAESGKVSFHSNGAKKFLGGPLVGLNGRSSPRYEILTTHGTMFPPEDYPLMRSLRNGEYINNVEMLVRHKDGRESLILVSSAPVGEQGRVEAAVLSIIDIS